MKYVAHLSTSCLCIKYVECVRDIVKYEACSGVYQGYGTCGDVRVLNIEGVVCVFQMWYSVRCMVHIVCVRCTVSDTWLMLYIHERESVFEVWEHAVDVEV